MHISQLLECAHQHGVDTACILTHGLSPRNRVNSNELIRTI